ncbi:MAG: CPBP family intramembrane metalloprotease [Acidobacteriota bacterium]|nr:CPBP family intramembrane metalloprotease [Acidobacteriota bacterium]
MILHALLRPQVILAALLTLLPVLGAAFFPSRVASFADALPRAARLACPALLCVPYALLASAFGIFRWGWLALYALLPVAIAVLLSQARSADPGGQGNWRDFLILAVLGLAVDLRWFEPAWPPGLATAGKMLLLDAGIFGFLAVRQLDGVGFDLRLRWRDAGIGLREFCFYAPLAIPLGLALGFLHFHASWPSPLRAAGAFLFTFLFIAIPEELFFRGWLQNLLERRLGRNAALLATAVLFGLAHWNKRTANFNWRYVLLAVLAGIFYGRAWRAQRRVGASAITHATVDSLWSLWLK